MNSFRIRHGLALTLIVVCLGCSGERVPKLTEVEGTLTMDGQPLPEVKVTFLPDPEKENTGRQATAVTDASGRFVMMYEGPKGKVPGVSAGWNRVILKDMIAANTSRDEKPLPIRFAAKYGDVEDTPLRYEIKTGEKQTIDP